MLHLSTTTLPLDVTHSDCHSCNAKITNFIVIFILDCTSTTKVGMVMLRRYTNKDNNKWVFYDTLFMLSPLAIALVVYFLLHHASTVLTS